MSILNFGFYFLIFFLEIAIELFRGDAVKGIQLAIDC